MTLEQAGISAWLSDENIGATYGVGIGSGFRSQRTTRWRPARS